MINKKRILVVTAAASLLTLASLSAEAFFGPFSWMRGGGWGGPWGWGGYPYYGWGGYPYYGWGGYPYYGYGWGGYPYYGYGWGGYPYYGLGYPVVTAPVVAVQPATSSSK